MNYCVYPIKNGWVLKNCSGVEEYRATNLDALLEKATRGYGKQDLRIQEIKAAIEEAGQKYNA